jgi:hypothetical protein
VHPVRSNAFFKKHQQGAHEILETDYGTNVKNLWNGQKAFPEEDFRICNFEF